jgi:hypothetical protein
MDNDQNYRFPFEKPVHLVLSQNTKSGGLGP